MTMKKKLLPAFIGLLFLSLALSFFGVPNVSAAGSDITVTTDKGSSSVAVEITNAALKDQAISVICFTPQWNGNYSDLDANAKQIVYLNQYNFKNGSLSFNFKLKESPVSGDYSLLVGSTEGVAVKKFNFGTVTEPPKVTHTVTLNPNGGVLPQSQNTIKVEDGKAIGALPTPTRNGYSFNGWYTASTGGERVTEAKIVSSSFTIYAQWGEAATPPVTEARNSFNSKGLKYKVVKKASAKASGSVQVMGPVSKKKVKTVTVPATVKSGSFSYKVESIANNAFNGCKKLTKVTLGKNVSKVGSKTFYNDKKLKSITIKGAKLKSVGKQAFKNIHNKAVIKVPSSKLKAYRTLLKGKGQKKTVKIIK